MPPLVIEELKLTPVKHNVPLFCAMLIVGVTIGFTVIVIGVLVAVGGFPQFELAVSTQRIKSPFTKSVPATPV